MLRVPIRISRDKKKLRIIRSPQMIVEELDLYKSRLHLRELFNQKEIPGLAEELEQIRDEVAEKEKEIVDLRDLALEIEEAKAKEIRYVKEFVISNYDTPVEIDLTRIVEDQVPISVAKEEIQVAYEKGQEDGQLMAMSTYKTEIQKYQEWMRQIEAVTESLKKEYLIKLEKFEDSLLNLSMMISENILNTEIDKDKSVVVNQVRKALRSIHNERIFKIHINPEVYSILEEVKSTLLEDERMSNEIEIYPDATIPLGGCLIDTSAGLIDARIANQLRKIRSSLESAQAVQMDSDEIQDELVEYDNMTQNRTDEIEDTEEIENELPEDIDYEDIPDEYKEMFSPDIFDESEMTEDGSIIIEDDKIERDVIQEEDEEIQEERIDYRQVLEEEERLKEKIKNREESDIIDDEEMMKMDDENEDPLNDIELNFDDDEQEEDDEDELNLDL